MTIVHVIVLAINYHITFYIGNMTKFSQHDEIAKQQC